MYNQCCFISCTCKLSPVSSTNTDPYQSCHMVGGLRLVGLFSRRIFLVPARFCVVTWLSGPWNEISLKTHRWSQRSLVWDQIPLTSLRSGTPWPYCFSSYIVGERRWGTSGRRSTLFLTSCRMAWFISTGACVPPFLQGNLTSSNQLFSLQVWVWTLPP